MKYLGKIIYRMSSKKRPNKKRKRAQGDASEHLSESFEEVQPKRPDKSYQPFQVLGETIYVSSNPKCVLQFQSGIEQLTTRSLQSWVEVQTAMDSLLKFIGGLPRKSKITVTTLYSHDSWNSIKSSDPKDQNMVIWTQKDGYVGSVCF